MAKKNAPTIKDVARAAGVSVGTVSKVINGIAVRKESQRKVQEAIEALHYEVNTYARGLKISKSGLVALIVPNTMNPFYATFADHIEAALYEHSLKLILCCSDEIPEKELEYLNSAKQNKVDGIIALTYSDIGSHITDGTPIVVLTASSKTEASPGWARTTLPGPAWQLRNCWSWDAGTRCISASTLNSPARPTSAGMATFTPASAIISSRTTSTW